jgi:hypothetical protein
MENKLTELFAERDRKEARISLLDEEITSVRAQLDHSKADAHCDLHWRANAEAARRHKARERQRLQNELADLNRQIRAQRAAEHDRAREGRFMDTARKLLPVETYNRILQAAHI